MRKIFLFIYMPRAFSSLKSAFSLILSCTGVAVLLFFPVIAQRVDVKLLEPVATLWGSALGAIAAVAGAVWVADRQASQQRRSAAALVAEMLHPVAHALNQLTIGYGTPSRAEQGADDHEPDIFSIEEWKSLSVLAYRTLDEYKDFQRKIHRFETGLNLLSATSLQAALAIESEFEDGISRAVGPLSRPNGADPLFGPGHIFETAAPSWSSRTALAKLNVNIQKHMAQLEKEAS